jgi:hypothetical protein
MVAEGCKARKRTRAAHLQQEPWNARRTGDIFPTISGALTDCPCRKAGRVTDAAVVSGSGRCSTKGRGGRLRQRVQRRSLIGGCPAPRRRFANSVRIQFARSPSVAMLCLQVEKNKPQSWGRINGHARRWLGAESQALEVCGLSMEVRGWRNSQWERRVSMRGDLRRGRVEVKAAAGMTIAAGPGPPSPAGRHDSASNISQLVHLALYCVRGISGCRSAHEKHSKQDGARVKRPGSGTVRSGGPFFEPRRDEDA